MIVNNSFTHANSQNLEISPLLQFFEGPVSGPKNDDSALNNDDSSLNNDDYYRNVYIW